jgi:hypothetical protein
MGGFPGAGGSRPTGRAGSSRSSSSSRSGSRSSSSTTTSTGGKTTTVTTSKTTTDPEAVSGKRGNGYRGKQNVSRSGKKCTPWANSVTHTPKIYPKSGLESNFCRNPVPHEGAQTIWCFIENGTPRKFWEYCDPVAAKKEVVTTKAAEYKNIMGESSEGCYKDSGNRDLPNLIRAGYGNPAKCFKMAMDAGY